MADEDTDEDGGIDITLGKLIAYPIGILLILSGLSLLLTSGVSGILVLSAGVISLPIARSRLKQSQGISINRWATVAIVIVLASAGGFVAGSNSGQGGSGQAEMISQSNDDLVPTIDQFEAGWQGGVEEENTATYFNSQTESTLRYNVTVYSSTSEAKSAIENAKPENTATESVSIGSGGFITVSGDNYRIWFRTANAVCFTGYSAGPGVITAESNAKDFARRCQSAINN